MKLIKSVLLGTTAALATVANAQAADLPSMKSAPIEYVRVCDAYGAGFFYIPGTQTCLRVGGFVRVEFDYRPGRTTLVPKSATAAENGFLGGSQDTFGIRNRGRIDIDARTQTAWGTVQTVFRLRGESRSGPTNWASANLAAGGTAAQSNSSANTIQTELAYVRFAGITAGIAGSNFNTFPGVLLHGALGGGFPNGMAQLAYTATFGGGFSATVALEDRGYLSQANGLYAQGFYALTAGKAASSTAFISKDTIAPAVPGNNPMRAPVLVGNLRVDQSWGFAQISGAVGTVGALDGAVGSVTSTKATANTQVNRNTTGWALGMGIGINLPTIAPGDRLDLYAAYASGLIDYAIGANLSGGSAATNGRFLGGVLRVDSPGFVNSNTGQIEKTRVWSLNALFTHYWSPEWRSLFGAQYSSVIVPGINSTVREFATGSAAGAGGGFAATFFAFNGNATSWQLNKQLIWSPVKDFDIGLEVAYLRLNNHVNTASYGAVSAGNSIDAPTLAAYTGPGLNPSSFSGKLRVQRTF